MFFLAGFVEGWGRGIQRIVDGYNEYPDKQPSFKVSYQSFAVILDNVNYGTEHEPEDIPIVDENIKSLLGFMDRPDGRSSREIAAFLGLASTNIATGKIKPLIEGGLVERTIPDAISSRNQRYRTTDHGRRAAG